MCIVYVLLLLLLTSPVPVRERVCLVVVLNKRVSQTSAVTTRVHFVMQGLLPPVVVLGCGFFFARVWLCEDL